MQEKELPKIEVSKSNFLISYFEAKFARILNNSQDV